MKAIKVLFFLCVTLLIVSCSDNDDKITEATIKINFSHNWDGKDITSSDFNTLNLTNVNGELLSISKLRYLVSNIKLVKSNGDTLPLSDYILVDVTNDLTTLEIMDLPVGTYNNIIFTFGFNEDDNIDGEYLDLNSASWNWPAMLGGGYHFMQYEGKYQDVGLENPYAYHMGTARKSVGVFEQNYFDVSLQGFTLSNNATVEIKMNIAEWFKNPNVWDLTILNTSLMPNYNAQIMMNQNGKSVFSLGEITQ